MDSYDQRRKAVIDMLLNPSEELFSNADEGRNTYIKTVVPFFIQMAEMGFVTYNSQSGVTLPGLSERAYVDGFMKKKLAKSFLYISTSLIKSLSLSIKTAQV